MKKLFGDLLAIFRNMNGVSKKLLRYGLPLIALVYLASLILYICAGRLLDYYAATQWLTDLLNLAKELLGVIAVPALLIEIIDTANGKQRAEKEAAPKDKD